MSKETITISKNEYDRLVERDRFLSCLEVLGVDNWDFYSDAWEMYESDED